MNNNWQFPQEGSTDDERSAYEAAKDIVAAHIQNLDEAYPDDFRVLGVDLNRRGPLGGVSHQVRLVAALPSIWTARAVPVYVNLYADERIDADYTERIEREEAAWVKQNGVYRRYWSDAHGVTYDAARDDNTEEEA